MTTSKKMWRRFLLFCGAALWSILGVVSDGVTGQSPYEGKKVRLIVFGTPGGGNDIWARLVARHMPKHIAGKPSFLVQNMPGGAGMIATNYLYTVAKPDGYTIGLIPNAAYQAQVVGRPDTKFDWANFGWIGTGEFSAYQFFIRADAGYKSLEDLRTAADPPPCGESGVGTINYAFLQILREVFGARLRAVVGYKGTADVNLAIERGEAACRATTISLLMIGEPTRTWFKTGFIRVLVQSGRQRDPALPDVPTLWELADKQRVSEEHRQLMRLVFAAQDFGRPFVAPPGAPKERLELFRDAFSKTMKDPGFLEEAGRAGIEVNHTGGSELERLAQEVTGISPKVAQLLKKLLE